ncbi:hypothetical protein C8J57DRAFT_731676 [Mycena rebaudengoi]|nr:hypothetical protein C8J57DRAFT_731676 [Mycena rebaudengoi]
MTSISRGVESAKEGLKTKGLHITDKGMSVKTSARMDREAYVDATQRGFVKAMGASSFGKGNESRSEATLSPPPLQSMSSVSSHTSSHSADEKTEKKKKGLFKRSMSGHKDS